MRNPSRKFSGIFTKSQKITHKNNIQLIPKNPKIYYHESTKNLLQQGHQKSSLSDSKGVLGFHEH